MISDKRYRQRKNIFLYCANGRGRFGEQTAGGHPDAFPQPRQPLFAVPALRGLEVLAGLACCEMLSQYPESALQGLSAVAGGGGGQQQFVTQTLRVHLLGIDF